ncbi:MAG: BamA/TamA family outer membrane protein [Pseudomonadota bacterium]|nr:BamA/TamA family outer membrane protein [Pseudomonadota bacterium]
MRFCIPGILIGLLTLCTATVAVAADPQGYRVDLAATGDGAMDATLRETSELISLRKKAPVSPFGLIARARGEVDRLKTVLESYGYYQSAVTITIDGMSLGSAGLGDALLALPKGRDARVDVAFKLGPLYHLRKVTIDGKIPEAAGVFSLGSGAPAVASTVLAAGARLLSRLQQVGYAFAVVDPPLAVEDAVLPVLDVSFHVDAGARVNLGAIRLEGLQRVHEKLVHRRLLVHTGQIYNPIAIEAARSDLLALGPFGSISVTVGKTVDSSGGVPVTFVMQERKRHAVALNAAYSSDLGGSAGVNWSDRNVFGNAETLNVAASLINLGGTATRGLGYDTSAKLLFPEFGHRDQSLQVAVGAIKQSLQAYQQKAVTSGIILSRKLSSVWSVSAGAATSREQIIQEGVGYNYTLVAVPLSLSYDSTHLASPLDDPLHGMRNSLSVTPTQSLGRPSASFVISQIKLAAYFDLHDLGWGDPGRSIIAARALAGQAQGASAFSLPPDQRFYGGGSGTVRGYRYQSVGPRFADGNPVGGTAIEAATLEFRQRFGKSLGAAFFVDGGEVRPGIVGAVPARGAVLPPSALDTALELKPAQSNLRLGTGAGVRYYTPIGPIRVDVAVPLHRRPRDDAFEIYIGLGQAF